MKVLKFGGTSVGTVESLLNVKKIVEAIEDRAIVVVSALGGLTDKLIATATLAKKGDGSYLAEIEGFAKRHHDIINSVVSESQQKEVTAKVDDLLAGLKRNYDGIALLGNIPQQSMNNIVSFGERMSSIIVAAMVDAVHFNSPDFIKTEKWYGKDIADSKLTESLIRKTFLDSDFKTAVVGGFISTDRDSGEITNLGRGGSDYTAALIAAALDGDILEIWTDVDGFMTADPRIVKSARVVNRMSFIESMQLCTGGAKVIYPPTIYPVFHKNIPIRILNTHNPTAPGTLITDESFDDALPVKGISSIKQTTLISVNTIDKNQLAEVNKRTLNAMTSGGVSVSLVSSPRTQDVVSFTVSAAESGMAMKILTDEFGPELVRGEMENIHAAYQLATLSIVGEGLKSIERLTEKITDCLNDNEIELHAMSDGISDSILTIVVNSALADKALQVLHNLIFD